MDKITSFISADKRCRLAAAAADDDDEDKADDTSTQTCRKSLTDVTVAESC